MAVISPPGRLVAPIIIVYLVLFGHAFLSVETEAQKTPKGHFVLVPGFFEGAWIWYEVATLLQQKGFQTTSVDLLAMGINPANANYVSTIEQFSMPLTDIINNVTGKVILVGHSFGGVPIALESEYFPAKVAKAVYLSAIMPKNGQSLATFIPLKVFASQVNEGAITFVYGNSSNPTQLTSYGIGPNTSALIETYYTLAPPKDVTLTLLLGKPQPVGPTLENITLTKSNYGSVPRYYIRTGKDMAVTPALQSMIIANNPPKQVFTLANADHGSFFSQPKQLANLLEYIAAL